MINSSTRTKGRLGNAETGWTKRKDGEKEEVGGARPEGAQGDAGDDVRRRTAEINGRPVKGDPRRPRLPGPVGPSGPDVP